MQKLILKKFGISKSRTKRPQLKISHDQNFGTGGFQKYHKSVALADSHDEHLAHTHSITYYSNTRLLRCTHDFTNERGTRVRQTHSLLHHRRLRGERKLRRKGKREIPPNSKSTNQHVPANSSLTHSELYEKEGPFTGASSINRSRSQGNRERREWADIRDGKEETLCGRYVGEKRWQRIINILRPHYREKHMRPLTYISKKKKFLARVWS